jgi:hypothetical protein
VFLLVWKSFVTFTKTITNPWIDSVGLSGRDSVDHAFEEQTYFVSVKPNFEVWKLATLSKPRLAIVPVGSLV